MEEDKRLGGEAVWIAAAVEEDAEDGEAQEEVKCVSEEALE